MTVFRIASRRYPGNSSEGARLYGGRWNYPGTAVIYTSGTRSLASLEVMAHNGAIPWDYRVVVIEIPDHLAIETVATEELSGNWPRASSTPDTPQRGTEWAQSQRTSVLRVPSAVIPAEFNYILNPLHPAFTEIRFDVSEGEFIDHRLRR